MMKSKINTSISVFLILFLFLKTANATEPPQENERLVNEVTVQNTEKNGEILSFSSYISIISEKLPELRKNKLSVDRSKNAVYAASAVDDFSIDGDFKYTSKDQYSALSPDQTYDVNGYASNMGLKRTVSKSGSRVATGIEYSDCQ